MKILLVNCVFPPEPVVSAQIGSDLALFLSTDNNVSVITPFPSRPYGFSLGDQIEEDEKRYHLFRLRSFIYPKSGVFGRFRESISFGLVCYKFIIGSHSLEKVYMNTWPIFAQLCTAFSCRRKKIPYDVHIQDIYPESLVNRLPSVLKFLIDLFLLPIDKYVLKNSSVVIAISENMRQYLSETRKIPLKQIEVITNWQDDKDFIDFQQSWPSENEKLTFMYLGNIGPVAGVTFLIESFAKSKCGGKLIIAGAGSEKDRCIRIANHFPLSDISFTNVPKGDVAVTQSKAHILILPTRKNTGNNSIPSKLPAYMLSSRPILALADRNSEEIRRMKSG
jgi:glycosyltransferase involved in cell wall biosynthesis